MVAHIYGYLLAEDVRGIIVTLTPAISHDVVSVLQVPLHGPGGWDSRISHHVSVSCLAQSLRFFLQHAAGYSFVLSLWTYCQVCSVCPTLPLVQLQCVHSQQLACCLVLGYEYRLVRYVSLEPLYRCIRYWRIQPSVRPLLKGYLLQLVEFFDRHLCLFIVSLFLRAIIWQLYVYKFWGVRRLWPCAPESLDLMN